MKPSLLHSLILPMLAVACSAEPPMAVVDTTPTSSASAPPASSSPPASHAPDASPPAEAIPPTGTCADPVPAGAATPSPLPVYAGTCPALAEAPALTAITSSGAERKFLVVRPSSPAAGETFPLVFAWHWLGGSAEEFAERLALQAVADTKRLVIVLPDAKGDLVYKWPMMASHSDARVAEDVQLFDDVLACVGAALPIRTHCVSTLGVSAGALFSAQLASARADRLASFVSVSGGVGDPVRSWKPAARPLPGLVLWGGAKDRFPNETLYIFDFQVGSKALADGLVAGGHAMVECIHDCGHDVPPFDPATPATPFADALFQFVLDHPFWTKAGASPYATGALPASFPSWCSFGKGTAVPRTGTCP